MNKKQKIIVSVVGITIVLLTLLGLTYAYFLTRIQGNTNDKSISVTTADLKLVYDDGSDGVVGGENLLPSDTVYTKIFTVRNEGNANIEYGVYLIDVINTFERLDDIKYTLNCTTDGTITCNEVTTETTFPSGIKQLITNEIEPKKTHTYTFKFTYKDTNTDQSVDMGKVLQAKLQIFGKNSNGEFMPYEQTSLSYAIINNAKLAKNGTTFKTTPLTIPAQAVSSANEKTLSIAEDDYGTSYYYRGSVTDNYMEFNNMCWRIVRVEGDGSIKIILAKEGLCSTIISSDTKTALINNGNSVVYGYDSSNHKADYENYNGGLYTTLKTWYTSSKLENKKSLLKNEKWCLGGNDNYRYDTTTGALLTDTSSTRYYYAAGKRLDGVGVERNATLKCSSEEDNVSDYIGTITADEVAYAGGTTSTDNKVYYLYYNAQSFYWSLSRHQNFGNELAFYVSSNGSLNGDVVDIDYGVRPAVTLATGAQIASGEGTISNPYKILES